MRRVNAVWMAASFGLACGAGCDDQAASTRAIEIAFEARAGDVAFAAGVPLEGIGTTDSTFTASDFRAYVHDVRVVTEDGAEVPVSLTDDGVWQASGVALLDFEDGAGGEEGNEPTNTKLVGEIPDDTGAIVGLRFRLGVPPDLNHLNVSVQPSPLNLSAMFWGWQAGFKYLRVEGRSTGQPAGLYVHVGATDCTGSTTDGFSCGNPNLGEIELDGFDPDANVVIADLAGLFAGVDVDADGGGAPGCMADVTDPECPPIFDAIGIDGAEQTFFRVGTLP